MRTLVLIILISALTACGQGESTAKKHTELSDWAQGNMSRAELGVKIAEAEMAIRLLENTDSESDELKQLRENVEQWQAELEALEQ